MPLLDFQPVLQKHFGLLGAQSLIHIREDKKVCCPWKSFWFSRTRRVDFNEETRFNRLSIKAVATLELRSLVHKVNGNESTKSSNLAVDSSPVPRESDEDSGCSYEEAERLRRSRISRANKGNTPWNKGKKHSPETIELIRERTKLAMQNPKVKMKLATLGHAQSKETRVKIGIGVRLGWQKRREMLQVQETCHFDWQNLIAEASRRGYPGEAELQWDSYKILGEQLEQEWLESVEQRKTMPKPKNSKRAPKSLEQRRKIAESIAAKWADPVYRDRVFSGLSKFHGFQIGTGVKKKKQPRPSNSAQRTKQRSHKKKSDGSGSSSDVDADNQILRPKKKRRDGPLYKDPLASSKLEMIKSIRAQRTAAETKKTEAIERARLLIAEAEKAAHTLEIAATKSPIAQASLRETRKLIAEAIQSIEYIETGVVTFNENFDHPSEPSPTVFDPVEEITDPGYDELVNQVKREVNGKESSLQSKDDEGFFFSDFGMQELLNSDTIDHSTNLNGHTLPPFYPGKQYNSLKTDGITGDQVGLVETHEESKSDRLPRVNGTSVDSVEDETPVKPVAVTRKWVRGRLVEVSE